MFNVSTRNPGSRKVGVAAGLATVMASQLYQISATDPLTYAVAPILVAAVALAANLLPAGRAMRVDPVRALQAE